MRERNPTKGRLNPPTGIARTGVLKTVLPTRPLADLIRRDNLGSSSPSNLEGIPDMVLMTMRETNMSGSRVTLL